jgi:hypothetical protein
MLNGFFSLSLNTRISLLIFWTHVTSSHWRSPQEQYCRSYYYIDLCPAGSLPSEAVKAAVHCMQWQGVNRCSPVRHVSVLLGTSMCCRTMSVLTLVRSHSIVGYVRRNLHVTTIWKCTCVFTWARSPMSALNVTASLFRWPTCVDISVCTLANDPTLVNSASPNFQIQISSNLTC